MIIRPEVSRFPFKNFIEQFFCFGVITRFNISGWLSGVKIGLVTGICFAATAIHISYVYEKRPLGLHLINGLYNILGNIIAAVISACWA